MEVMFSWTKPNEHNCLSSLSRFSELELGTYINEFELRYGPFEIEKSVNIDYIPRNIRHSKLIEIILLKLIISINIWRDIKRRYICLYDTC